MKIRNRVLLLLLLGISFFAFYIISAQASFHDIQGHKYQEAIEFIQSRQIVSGYPDGTFRANNTINRAELLTIIVGQKYKNLSSKDCFSDVKAAEWYAKFVCKGRELGIVAGYPDGSFRPEQNVSFVEALIMLQRAHNISINTSATYWFENSVRKASEMNGIPLDIILFDTKITRGQMAEMMTRILKYEENTLDAYLGTKKDYIVTYEDIELHKPIGDFWEACQDGDAYYCRDTTIIPSPLLPLSQIQPSTPFLSKPILTSPTNGAKISSASGDIYFTWSASPNAVSYDFILGKNDGTSTIYSAGTNTNYDVALSVLNPLPGQTSTYSWQIRANGFNNTSSTSAPWSFMITLPSSTNTTPTGAVAQYLQCPTPAEIAQVESSFQFIWLDYRNLGQTNLPKEDAWNDYPYKCDFGTTDPSRLKVYNVLLFLKNLQFSTPLPFTGGVSPYDYITLKGKFSNPSGIWEGGDRPISPTSLIRIEIFSDCDAMSTGGRWPLGYGEYGPATYPSQTSSTLVIDFSNVFSRLVPFYSGNSCGPTASPAKPDLTNRNLLNGYIDNPVNIAGLIVHEFHHAIAAVGHTDGKGGDLTIDEIGAWAAEFYFHAWVSLYATNVDANTKYISRQYALDDLSRITNKCPSDQNLKKVVNQIAGNICS